MNKQHLTRSNSLNEKESGAETVSKGRKFSALSPELEGKKIIKKPRSKSSTRDMEVILDEIKNNLASINTRLEKLPLLEQKLDAISDDLSHFKNEVNSIKERITNLEDKHKNCTEIIDNNHVEINIAKQLKLEEQVMITDIPKHMTKEKFITDINVWTKNLLTDLGHRKLILTKNSKSGTAFIHFWNVREKYRFMDFVKRNEKQGEKYIPITNEKVFDLNEDDVNKPTILHFQTPMTEINQAIFKKARTYKKEKIIENCWIMNGSVFIKRNGQTRGTRIDSIKQLNDIMNSIGAELDAMEANASTMEI